MININVVLLRFIRKHEGEVNSEKSLYKNNGGTKTKATCPLNQSSDHCWECSSFRIVMGTGSRKLNESESLILLFPSHKCWLHCQKDIACETHLTTFVAQVNLFPNKKGAFTTVIV